MADFATVGQTAADTVNVSKQALVDSFTQAWSQVILLAPKMVAMVSVVVMLALVLLLLLALLSRSSQHGFS